MPESESCLNDAGKRTLEECFRTARLGGMVPPESETWRKGARKLGLECDVPETDRVLATVGRCLSALSYSLVDTLAVLISSA